MRKILDDEPLSGARAVGRSLRMHRNARLVDATDYPAATVLIGRLCRCWGAVADLLIPVSPSGPIPEPYDYLLSNSEIDSISASPSVAEVSSGLGDTVSAVEYPALLVAASRPRDQYRSIVATTVDEDSPWHLAYLAVLGLLPADGDRVLLDSVLANPDLTLDQVLPIERQVCNEPGLEDLLGRLSGPTAISASIVALSPRAFKSSVYGTDGLLAERSAIGRQKGSGIVVIYRPGNVSDLCLLWNLRSLHGWPGTLPIGVPWSESDKDIAVVIEQLSYLSSRRDVISGALSYGLVLVSASVPSSQLAELVDKVNERPNCFLEWAQPDQLLAPAYAPARSTDETPLFADGEALVSTRSQGDRDWLAVTASIPIKPPLRLSVALRGVPVPTGHTLRGDPLQGPRYLGGAFSTDGRRDELRKVVWPHKWTMLRAVASDHGLRVEPSSSGRSALALISLLSDINEARWLAHRPLLDLLYRTAETGGMTWFKSRAAKLAEMAVGAQTDRERVRGEFLAAIESIGGAEGAESEGATWFKGRAAELAEMAVGAQTDRERMRDEFLAAIESMSVSLDAEGAGFLSFSDIKSALGDRAAADVWIRWAEARQLVVRGAVLACARCGAKIWRPTTEVAQSVCPGCGRASDHWFDPSSLPFRFRLGEPLRRAIENDSIYHILIMRYLISLTSIREDWLVGAHPGIDIYDNSGDRIGEADVLLLFADAATLPVEVKRHATGIRAGDLTRLEDIADRWSGIGTVLGFGDERASIGDGVLNLACDEPRPRRLITADQWLAPYARPTISQPPSDESYWRGGDVEGTLSEALDRRFPKDILALDPLRGTSNDPVADLLKLTQ